MKEHTVMQPAIILDLQKEFFTEATSAPKLFRNWLSFPRSGVGTELLTLQRHVKRVLVRSCSDWKRGLR